jgi:hypothetical protein
MRNSNLKTQSVIVTNITTGEIDKFLAMRSAGEYLETSHSQIGVYARNNKLFRGIYSIEINKKVNILTRLLLIGFYLFGLSDQIRSNRIFSARKNSINY